MVLHALTLGLDNDRTRRRLFETQKLTLDKAVNLCSLTEDTETEMRKLKINEEVSAVYKTKAKTRTHVKTPAKMSQGSTYSQDDHMCDKCGRKHLPRQCTAFGKECYLCKKANHLAKCCRSGKTSKRVHMVVDAESDSDILHIQVDKVGKKLLATINVHHADSGDTELRCQLHTAASCNVLSVSDYEKLGSPTMMPSSTTLTMYNGSKVQSKGRCHLNLRESGQVHTLMFEVVQNKNATLLSLDTCLLLQLIAVTEEVHLVDEQAKKIVEALIKEYEDVFNGMGCLPGVYDIVIDKDVPPVQNRPRKVAYGLKEDFEKKIGELEKQGVIAKVETPTAWISNCIAVRKPNGSVRVCIDPSDLNKTIQRNHYPLPTIDEVLPTLKDANIFSLGGFL